VKVRYQVAEAHLAHLIARLLEITVLEQPMVSRCVNVATYVGGICTVASKSPQEIEHHASGSNNPTEAPE
jgi:hypothetical protein